MPPSLSGQQNGITNPYLSNLKNKLDQAPQGQIGTQEGPGGAAGTMSAHVKSGHFMLRRKSPLSAIADGPVSLGASSLGLRPPF